MKSIAVLSRVLTFILFMAPAISWSQTSYLVKRGDTILKVADRLLENKDPKNPRRYEIAQKIRRLNPGLKDPNSLEPGQTLMLPDSPSTEKDVATSSKPAHIPERAKPAVSVESTSPIVASHPVASPPVEPTQAAKIPPAPEHPPAHAPVHSAAEESNSHESGHSNFFFLQPRYQVLEIMTQDLATKTKASMKSKSSFGLDVQYGVILNDHFHLLFQVGFTQTQFEKIEGPGASVNHTSETLKSFAAGLAYEATSRLHLDLMLMSAERTFLLPVTLPDYELEAVMIPGAELNVSYDLYSGTTNIFGISAIGEYLSKVERDSVEYKSAFEPIGALYWKSNYGHDRVNYKATLLYKHGHQDTSLSQQNEDLTSFGLGFYF